MIKHNKGVRDFFKNDYPKLYLLSGSQIPTDINLKDKSRIGYYWNVLAVTWFAINQLEDTPQHPYKTIIVERFVKRTRMIKVRELISYSQGKSNDLANQALKKFAETFRQEQIKNKVFPLVEFD
ncbi:hypothetical protein [Lactobacillus crispatus]|uniref:hypothetical protein n=1 Tax=Lactobacillus crispatus TaxID=47770 RepID=UPI00123BD9D0|nr:hypothetical protein [Lactobacillus crispatus]KAA8807412.1 hypothetical protein F1C08_10500 [Lactobacillus crispatus]